MVEITDEESAKAWHEGAPTERRVPLAARSALRAMPGIALEGRKILSLGALEVCRLVQTSVVLATRPSHAIVEVANSLRPAFGDWVPLDDVVEFSANSAHSAVTGNAFDSVNASALSASAAASDEQFALAAGSEDSALSMGDGFVLSAGSARQNDVAITYGAASLDATRLETDTPADLFRATLWPEKKMPDGLAVAYATLTAFWNEDTKIWGYWKRWYEGMLNGQPLPWDLLEAVALEIPEEDWEKGPEHIAKKIRKIEARFEPKPLDEVFVSRRVEELFTRATTTEITATGLADLIDEVISELLRELNANCVPDEFSTLEKLPPILRRIAKGVRHPNNDVSRDALEQEIQRLAAEVTSLQVQLEEARKSSVKGILTKAFLEQTGKSLGDWKMWAALGSGVLYLSGNAALADSVESLLGNAKDLFGSSNSTGTGPPAVLPTVKDI